MRLPIVLLLFFLTLQLPAQNFIKEGNAYFDEGNFQAAIDLYLKAVQKDSSNVELRHRIGICYLNLSVDRAIALPHLEWVVKQPKFDPIAYYDLGQAYLCSYQFDKAISAYEQYLKASKDEEWGKLAKLGVQQAKNAKVLTKKPINVEFYNVGEEINTKNNEFQPYIPADESSLVFTSDRKYDSRLKINYNNIYVVEKKHDKWKRPLSVGVVNSREDEFVSGLSSNDKYLLVMYRRYEAYDDIFIAEKDGTRIAKPEDPGANVNSADVESGATISYTGDTLIFASDREGGQGGLDLWMSLRLPNGSWGIAVNLGPEINSPYDEDFPHLMPDGKTMYFSSQGHNSMGGFDVFKTKLNSSGKWSNPMNFGYPVNTPYDNNTIAMSRNYRYGYVADIREGGFGGLDIYRVVFNEIDPTMFVHNGKIQIGTGEGAKPIPQDVDPEIKIVNAQTDEVVGKYKYDHTTQHFIAALFPGDYTVIVEADGYKQTKEPVYVPDMLMQTIYSFTIALEPK